MKLELVRTSEADGMWIKVLRDGFPIKGWLLKHGEEYTISIEAEVYFDKLVEASKKIEVLKSVII